MATDVPTPALAPGAVGPSQHWATRFASAGNGGKVREPWCTSIGKPVVYLSQIDVDEEQISFDGLFFVTILGEVT